MAAAKDVMMDAAIGTDLSEVDGIFTLKEEQKSALKAFLGGQWSFALLMTGFKSYVKHCST